MWAGPGNTASVQPHLQPQTFPRRSTQSRLLASPRILFAREIKPACCAQFKDQQLHQELWLKLQFSCEGDKWKLAPPSSSLLTLGSSYTPVPHVFFFICTADIFSKICIFQVSSILIYFFWALETSGKGNAITLLKTLESEVCCFCLYCRPVGLTF